jgi:anaerobic selenocysteine-containing dehydrogenase
VRRAGFRGRNALTLGAALFRGILARRAGTLISVHEYDEVWSLLRTVDRRIHLEIPEMLTELAALATEAPPGTDYPFILMAGERRSYNANQIYRDPAWRKVDPDGAMRIHPDDAGRLELSEGSRARCRSAHGEIDVTVELDDGVRRGTVTLPHGYGQRYKGGEPIGPALNRLTSTGHCDPFSKTPYHKYVPVHVVPAD